MIQGGWEIFKNINVVTLTVGSFKTRIKCYKLERSVTFKFEQRCVHANKTIIGLLEKLVGKVDRCVKHADAVSAYRVGNMSTGKKQV